MLLAFRPTSAQPTDRQIAWDLQASWQASAFRQICVHNPSKENTPTPHSPHPSFFLKNKQTSPEASLKWAAVKSSSLEPSGNTDQTRLFYQLQNSPLAWLPQNLFFIGIVDEYFDQSLLGHPTFVCTVGAVSDNLLEPICPPHVDVRQHYEPLDSQES